MRIPRRVPLLAGVATAMLLVSSCSSPPAMPKHSTASSPAASAPAAITTVAPAPSCVAVSRAAKATEPAGPITSTALCAAGWEFAQVTDRSTVLRSLVGTVMQVYGVDRAEAIKQLGRAAPDLNLDFNALLRPWTIKVHGVPAVTAYTVVDIDHVRDYTSDSPVTQMVVEIGGGNALYVVPSNTSAANLANLAWELTREAAAGWTPGTLIFDRHTPYGDALIAVGTGQHVG